MANSHDAARRSVLIVDDDRAVAQLIAHGIVRAGMRAEIAASREDAERALTGFHDAIVADYVLPDGTGLDLARGLRAKGDDRPIVIVTAFGSESVAREALAIPGCDYVPKTDGFACHVPIVLERAFRHRAIHERLQATEARTRSLIEHLPAGMYVSEAAGRITFANRRLEQLVGAAPGELEGRPWQDLVPEEDRPGLRRAAARAWGIGEPVSLEHRIAGGPDGVRSVLHEAHPVLEDGGVARLEGFVVDITARRRLEDDVACAYGHLAAVHDVARAVSSALTTDRVLSSAGEALRTRLGVALGLVALVEEGCFLRVSARGAAGSVGLDGDLAGTWPLERFREASRALEERCPVVVEGLDLEADRASPLVRLLVQRLSVQQLLLVPLVRRSEVLGLVAVGWAEPAPIPTALVDMLEAASTQIASAVDNAALFEAAQEQARARRVYEQAFLDAADGVVVTDARGRIAEANPAFCRSLGLARDQLRGRELFALLRADGGAGSPFEVAADGGAWVGDVDCTGDARAPRSGDAGEGAEAPEADAASGQTRELRLRRLSEDHAHGDGFVGLLTDRSEVRRLEAQLKRAQRLESLGRLAGGIAHDFNNSLTGIVGFSELALLEAPETLPARGDIRRVIAIAKDATATIRKLLSFARRKKLSRELVDVGGLLGEVAQICRRTFPETIRVQLDAVPELLPVKADPAELEQALMNLCVNGRDALAQGGTLTLRAGNVAVGDAPSADVDGLPRGEYVRVEVQDDGPGLDAATRERIFEPFFTTKPKERGTGLGLSMVYGCVRAHGGAIRVDSALGRGARFSIYLPASLGVTVAREASSVVAPRGTERILVVEDEASVREVAARVLGALGYRVTAASGGQEALAQFTWERRSFDLVLTDLVMPQGTGAELVRALATVSPELPVIVMTGYGEAERAQDDLADLPVRWAQKPLDRRQLARLVRDTLDAAAQVVTPRATRLSA